MSEDEHRYITVEDAADILKVSTRQVRRYASGENPRIRKRLNGRFVRFHVGDVAALAYELEQRARSASPPPNSPNTLEGKPLPPQTTPEQEQAGNEVDLLTVGELISLQEAAEYAGLSQKSMRNYALQGRLRAKKLGSQWVTTQAAVNQYLSSRNTQTIPRKYRKEP